MTTPILKLVGATKTIDFLSGNESSGINLVRWTPVIAQYKDGGIWADNPMLDGRYPVDVSFENAVETLEITASGVSADDLIRRLQDLRRLLEEASSAWTVSNAQIVYLMARAAGETNTRYAPIYAGSVPEDNSFYEAPFLQPNCADAVMQSLTLTLERGHWSDTIPGNIGSSLNIQQYRTSYLRHTSGDVEPSNPSYLGWVDETVANSQSQPVSVSDQPLPVCLYRGWPIVNLVRYDDGTTTYTTDNTHDVDLFPSTPAVGDMCYFNAQWEYPNVGTNIHTPTGDDPRQFTGNVSVDGNARLFHIVFPLTEAGDVTMKFQVYEGSPTNGWVDIDVQITEWTPIDGFIIGSSGTTFTFNGDYSQGGYAVLSVSGYRGISGQVEWATNMYAQTTVDGESAYWCRLYVSAVSTAVTPTCGKAPYAPDNQIRIPAVTNAGDLPAGLMLHFAGSVWDNVSSTKFLVGIRSADRFSLDPHISFGLDGFRSAIPYEGYAKWGSTDILYSEANGATFFLGGDGGGSSGMTTPWSVGIAGDTTYAQVLAASTLAEDSADYLLDNLEGGTFRVMMVAGTTSSTQVYYNLIDKPTGVILATAQHPGQPNAADGTDLPIIDFGSVTFRSSEGEPIPSGESAQVTTSNRWLQVQAYTTSGSAYVSVYHLYIVPADELLFQVDISQDADGNQFDFAVSIDKSGAMSVFPPSQEVTVIAPLGNKIDISKDLEVHFAPLGNTTPYAAAPAINFGVAANKYYLSARGDR